MNDAVVAALAVGAATKIAPAPRAIPAISRRAVRRRLPPFASISVLPPGNAICVVETGWRLRGGRRKVLTRRRWYGLHHLLPRVSRTVRPPVCHRFRD